MLAKANRFHRRNHVSKIYKTGSSVRGQFISLKISRKINTEPFRVAVVVSKKVSKSAVVRNHIRRRIFAALEKNTDILQNGTDIVLTVYDKSVASMPFSELQNQVWSLIMKNPKTGAK